MGKRIYADVVARTQYYCPACGARDVWAEPGPGDYYQGPSYYCRSCLIEFHLPNGAGEGGDTYRVDKRELDILIAKSAGLNPDGTPIAETGAGS